MKIELNEMTLKNDKVRYALLQYMERVSAYERFDVYQLCHVYVDSNKDFCAFDSKDYKIGYNSNDHKVMDILNSRYTVGDVPFCDLRAFVAGL